MPHQDLTLAAVVVTHNRLDKLKLTLTRLFAEPVQQVVVVDNASTDDTASWLALQRDPRLILYHSTRNLGGAGGFSVGLKIARDCTDADWIVAMDDDGRPHPGAFATFCNLPLQDWDAIGAAVLYPDGSICEMNRPYCNPFWNPIVFLRTLAQMPLGRGRKGFHLPDTAYAATSPVQAIDMTSFVGFFLSRGALNDAGLPDPKLFIYGDDQLYTLQMRRKGLRIGFAPQIRFEHDTSAREGKSGVVLQPMWKVYYMYRNALIAYRMAAGLWFWPLVPVLLRKWRRKARDYESDAALFRTVLDQAVRDGLSARLDRTHDEVLRLAERK